MATRMSPVRWLILIVILAITTVAFVRWDRQRAVKPIPMATVEKQDIYSGIVTNGKAEPVEYRDIRPAVDGEIASLIVHDADTVKAGQKVAEVSQQQIASDVETARASLAEAEESLRLLKQGGTSLNVSELKTQFEIAKRERDDAAAAVAQNERLLEKGAIARIELDESRRRLAKAEADLALAGEKLSRRYDPEQLSRAEAELAARRAALNSVLARQRSSAVTAPLGGTVFSIAVRQGDYVKPGDLLMRVGDLHQIRVRVYVDEPDLGRVRKGQPVLITWDGLPGKEWRGAVAGLPSEIKEVGTRKVGEVSCILENPANELLPNMNLNVEIITEQRPGALTVPREAVFGNDSARSVFLVENGVLKAQPVKTGITNITRIEVQQGVNQGQKVAVASETPLSEGMHVRNIAE
jgi:HlyD family secretion protein